MVHMQDNDYKNDAKLSSLLCSLHCQYKYTCDLQHDVVGDDSNSVLFWIVSHTPYTHDKCEKNDKNRTAGSNYDSMLY